jgi:three-Cys-motif partner protein
MAKSNWNPIIEAQDDGLAIPKVGKWALSKYNLAGRYCQIFTTSMQKKWSNLVYIDLFSGSGYAKIKGSNQIVYGSPLIALSIPVPFTKYILCEKDEKLAHALKIRVERDFGDKNITLFNADANEIVDDIKNALPRFSRESGMLSFCFVDPFSLNLHFETIKKLGNLKMDFLILLALHMDANRNYKTYLETENDKIDLFLDDTGWRKEKVNSNESFVRFLAEHYKKNMQGLGYKVNDTFQQIRSDAKNLPLYYLAFFSKHDLGNTFWKEVQKYTNPQQSLDFNHGTK